MSVVADLLERVRCLLFRSREDRELAEELAFHLAMEADRLEREEGLAPAEARRRARLTLGGVEQVTERVRDACGTRLLEDLVQDLRHGVRQLRREPGFAALAVLTLALGIAANATMFGVVDRILLRPPPGITDPGRVLRLYFRERSSIDPGHPTRTGSVTSFPVISALRDGLAGTAAVAGFAPTRATLGRGAGARQVSATAVSGDYFGVAGTRAAVGRLLFGSDADLPIVVLSHGFWERTLGGDPGIVGRTLLLDGRPVVVVGVAARGFRGVEERATDLWAPARMLGPGLFIGWHQAGSFMWQAIARLRAGSTPAQVAARGTAAYRTEVRSWAQTYGRDTLGQVVPGSIIAARGPTALPAAARVSLWLEGVAAIVLLVACANIAGLLLARAIRRRRELAVRLALGAGRGRLVRQHLTETLLLALLAGSAGVLLTFLGGRAVRALLVPALGLEGGVLNARVLAFTAGATLLSLLLAGLAPALRAGRPEVGGALRAGPREGGARRSHLQTGLLVAQATLSVVLLAGAGLFVLSLHRVSTRDVGIDLSRVLRATMPLRKAGFDSARVVASYRRAYERVRRLPAVEAATIVAGSAPLAGLNAGPALRVPGRADRPSLEGGGPYYSYVDDGFFRTLGARIVRGRDFTPEDARPGAHAVIVNRMLAGALWPHGDIVGHCLMLDAVCHTVVGVVENVLAFRLVRDDRAIYYVPRSDSLALGKPPSALLLRVRAGVRPGAAAAAVRRELQSLDPDMPYIDVRPYADLVAPQLAPWRLAATMFGIFGALALAMAAVGLFSVLAYTVAQRRHEVGVRVALGARSSDVVWMIVLDGLRVIGAGLALGTVAVLALGRFVEPLLYATSPRDPRVLAVVAAGLLLTAAAASLLPARRAARVDPMEALRVE